MKNNSYTKTNKKFWEKMVKEDCGFCKPWLNLDPKVVKKVAEGKLKKIPKPLNDIFPISILKNVKGKNVLCLASGGGQQSAVFSLLGANVTVVDISDGQLAADQKAAKHYGYKVKTIQTDMNNLSKLKANSFDIVYQAPSIGYVENLKKIHSQVSRILKKGGLFRADGHNPLAQFVHESSWDGKGYRISVPYTVRKKRRAKDENVIEFRHYLDETFNALVESGFTITKVQEAPEGLYQTGKSKPGTWEHSLKYIPGHFAILARKK